MKKTINVFLIILLSFGFSYAQSLSQVVVANSGATITGASNTLSFTAGEAVIGSISNGASLEQGFWTGAATGITVSAEDLTFENQISIYPNPVNNYLDLYFNDLAAKDFVVKIYDSNGKQVLDKKILNNTEKETLNLSEFSAGIYILKIAESNSSKTRSIKIIKH